MTLRVPAGDDDWVEHFYSMDRSAGEAGLWSDPNLPVDAGRVYILAGERLLVVDLPEFVPVATLPSAVIAGFADLDMDGTNEIVGVSTETRKLLVFDPDDFSAPVFESEDAVEEQDWAICDLEGDGRLDFLAAGMSGLRIWAGADTEFFSARSTEVLDDRLWGMVGANLKGDGRCSLIAHSENGRPKLLDTDGQMYLDGGDPGLSDTPLLAADFDGDGVDEILVGSRTGLTTWRWLDGGFQPTDAVVENADFDWYPGPTVVDYDGDGDLDVIMMLVTEDGGSELGVFDGLDPGPLLTMPLEEAPYAVASANVDATPGKEIVVIDAPVGSFYGCE